MTSMPDVMQQWKKVLQKEEKILLLVGAPGSGKSQLMRKLEFQSGWKYVEAKELLRNNVFEVDRAHRAVRARENLMESVAYLDAKVTLVDNVEILFAPIYNINPIEILLKLSQDHPLVVGWTGEFDGEELQLEYNGKKRFFTWKVKDPEHIFLI